MTLAAKLMPLDSREGITRECTRWVAPDKKELRWMLSYFKLMTSWKPDKPIIKITGGNKQTTTIKVEVLIRFARCHFTSALAVRHMLEAHYKNVVNKMRMRRVYAWGVDFYKPIFQLFEIDSGERKALTPLPWTKNNTLSAFRLVFSFHTWNRDRC